MWLIKCKECGTEIERADDISYREPYECPGCRKRVSPTINDVRVKPVPSEVLQAYYDGLTEPEKQAIASEAVRLRYGPTGYDEAGATRAAIEAHMDAQ
jgi:DNA-directed RNA polymerase subunit RPC12/RpoP